MEASNVHAIMAFTAVEKIATTKTSASRELINVLWKVMSSKVKFEMINLNLVLADCENTEGSYSCLCPAGYYGDGMSEGCQG